MRDHLSYRLLNDLGISAVVLPDALSLLSIPPEPQQRIRDVTVVNVLNVSGRADREELESGWTNWARDLRELVRHLEGPVELLANDHAEAAYARQLDLGVPVKVAHSADDVLSQLATARAVLATRMHYGLAADLCGRPMVMIPYNGKVRPTAAVLGLEGRVVDVRDRAAINQLLGQDGGHGNWECARHANLRWLQDNFPSMFRKVT